MYDLFRKNNEEIQKDRDVLRGVLYEILHGILTINNEQIQDKHWGSLIEEMEACFRHIVSMDISRVKIALLK